MKKKQSYQILPDTKIIIEYYSGIIDFNVIVNLSRNLKNDVNFNPTFKTIIDIRDAYFIFKNSEIKDFIFFLQSQNLICNNRFVAILTNTPNQVAVSTLYEIYMKEHFLNIRIFSTLEAAINWLGINEQNDTLNRTILKFKNFLK